MKYVWSNRVNNAVNELIVYMANVKKNLMLCHKSDRQLVPLSWRILKKCRRCERREAIQNRFLFRDRTGLLRKARNDSAFNKLSGTK